MLCGPADQGEGSTKAWRGERAHRSETHDSGNKRRNQAFEEFLRKKRTRWLKNIAKNIDVDAIWQAMKLAKPNQKSKLENLKKKRGGSEFQIGPTEVLVWSKFISRTWRLSFRGRNIVEKQKNIQDCNIFSSVTLPHSHRPRQGLLCWKTCMISFGFHVINIVVDMTCFIVFTWLDDVLYMLPRECL